MKHNKFSDIGQFRHTIETMKRAYQFVGMDENNEPIMNEEAVPPVVTFNGTVKLHGTNAGIAMDKDDNMWCQSRTNIITIEKDNAGFAFFVEGRKDIFRSFILQIRKSEKLTNETIIIFGEWVGKGIQKGCAVHELPKMFVIFAVKVLPLSEEDSNHYLTKDKWWDFVDFENRIFNINDYESFTLDIDFANVADAQNKLIEITNAVEKECPVGKVFGISGIGEGVCWVGYYKNTRYVFKVKGEKHSVSKVKTLAPVDTEKLNSIKEFVEYAVTENRLNQGIEQVFTTNSEVPDIKGTGRFLKWVANDVIKEESDTLNDNKLEPKDVNKHVSVKARIWFMAKLNSMVGL